jgi:site-specific recombinase
MAGRRPRCPAPVVQPAGRRGRACIRRRYPDLTEQARYLLHAVEQTIHTELVSEILFIRAYDSARLSIRDVVDMPNARLDLIIKLLYQNKGVLSRSKRSLFKEISDDELARIEVLCQAAFGGPLEPAPAIAGG